MDYHLHRDGQNAGVFPLQELQRRRLTGELSGTELVWTEGMASWEALDIVLQRSGLATPTRNPPPRVPRPARNPWVVFALCAAAVTGVVGAAFFGVFAAKFVRRVRSVVQLSQSRNNSADGLTVTMQPLTLSSNTLTEAEVSKRRRAFRVRQYIEAYARYGDHTKSWDADARTFLESWLAAYYGGDTNLPPAQPLGDKLAAQPDCNDPLVLTIAAATAVELHEKARRLERALAGFTNSPYKAYPKFYAAICLADELGNRSGRVPSLERTALDSFRAGFTDGSFQPGDEEELSETLIHGWGHTFFQRNPVAVIRAVREAKGFNWLALVLDGENQIDEAWRARGGGYANTVTDQGWQQFSEHLAQARSALTRAWELQPARPLAPARMITVAMAEAGAAEMRTWFDRAVQAQLDYPEAWSNFRWGLRPRWNGSHQALLALGARAVDTRRFDTDVPRKLFDCISDVESELQLQPGEHIYGRPDVWPDLQRMYEGYIAEPSETNQQRAWRSAYATIAFLAGRYEVARKQLEAVDWQPTPHSLTGYGRDLSLLPLQVAALTGKDSAVAEQAEASYAQFDLPEAVKLYSKLSASADADARAQELCRCRLAALQQEERLAKGESIDLLPSGTNDPNWVLTGNVLRWPEPAVLEVESQHRGHGLYCRTRLGAAFEVTGEFEVVRSSNQDFQAGLLMGLPDTMNSRWYAFRIKRNATEGALASFSYGFSRQQVARPAPVRDRLNEFRFRLQNGRADAWVNGTQVLHHATPVRTLRLYRSSFLGLGAYYDMNDTVVRYHNIKVRRLSSSGSAPTSESAED